MGPALAWEGNRFEPVTHGRRHKKAQAQGFFGLNAVVTMMGGMYIYARYPHEFEGDEALQKSSSSVGVKVSGRWRVQRGTR